MRVRYLARFEYEGEEIEMGVHRYGAVVVVVTVVVAF